MAMATADTYFATGGVSADAAPGDHANRNDEPVRLWRKNDADYEAGRGMEPLEDIHAEREAISRRFAELKPRFGPAKMWEHERKALLALVELEARRSWGQSTVTQGLKLTEDAVNAVAHHDPRYVNFLNAAVADAIEYEQLAIRMGNLEERANRGQVIGRLRSAEAHFEPGIAA